MKLEIRKTKDPVLRQPTEKVSDFGMEFQHFIDDMIETMRGESGIGLAAPQVGKSIKAITCEFAGDKEAKIKPFPLTVVCNPEITDYSKALKNMVEGCLSFPGMEILVKRPKKVTVKGFDRYGKPIEILADKLQARALQHEIDHLNCILLPDHLQEINLIFIGTGTLGIPTMEALATDLQYSIKMVVTGIVEGSGRNKSKAKNPVLEAAKRLNLPTMAVSNINDPAVIEKLAELKPDIGIMADFGQIISKEILDIPKHGIVNIHPSLLPKYRGPSPMQQTILEGDKETGISLILTAPEMDAGGIIAQATADLNGSETEPMLKEFLAKGAANLVINSVSYYIAGDLKPESQNESKATYTHLFKKEDGFVDKDTDAKTVNRKIRAFAGWPKVYTEIRGRRVQLLSSHFDRENKLVIDRVKPEGRKEMSYDEFIRGYHTELTFEG